MKRIYVLFMSMIVQQLCGMEKEPAPISCTKIENVNNLIPGIKLPIGIGFVKNNVIAVLEKNSFTVCDMQTGHNIIQRKSETPISDFAINKEGTKVAVSAGSRLTVFNAVTGEREWTDPLAKFGISIAFNPKDCNQVISFDKSSDKLFIHCKTLASEIKTQNTMLDTHVFAHHPQNTEVFYGCTSQSFYQYNYIIQGEPHCHDLHQCSESEDYIMGQCYTSDGSYILTVMRAANETIVYRLSAKERDTKWMMWNVGKYYSSILCYPNNRMLFLLDCKNKIECWDYSKSEHIHTIEIANQEDIPSIGYMEKRLAVSHDGRTLFVALKDKCCMIELPFEALCDQQIKENLFVIMSLLKRYEKDDVALIGDAIYAIILKLIMLYKYLP